MNIKNTLSTSWAVSLDPIASMSGPATDTYAFK